jgi:hypothetical protein
MISHRPTAICSRSCRMRLAIFEMADIHEQHTNIKFCFKLGKMFMETHEMMKMFMETHEMMKTVCGDQCMRRTRCYEWFKRSKDGRQSTHDEPPLGRPSTSCDDALVAQVRKIILSNRHLTVPETAERCNISIESCHDILTNCLVFMP